MTHTNETAERPDNRGFGNSGAHGVANAKAWLESIIDMTDRLRAASDSRAPDVAEDYDTSEEVRTKIMESVLSVQVRSGWYSPGDSKADKAPMEFEILLTWGGPGARLIGTLNQWGEPETCHLEAQDWGTSWARVPLADFSKEAYSGAAGEAYEKAEAALMAFASVFYFSD